jgi:hypothetical protein
VSMRFIPSSTARRSTRRACSGSSGSPKIPRPVRRIAPKPMRLTRRSPPKGNVPASAAFGLESWSVMCLPFHLKPTTYQTLSHGDAYLDMRALEEHPPKRDK